MPVHSTKPTMRDGAVSGANALAAGIRATADSISHAGHSATDAVAQVGHDAADGVSRIGKDAADAVKDSARYVRSHGARQIIADLRDVARAHPGKTVIAAVAVGFLAARALRAD
jgi:hypothetical protein